SGGVWSVGRAVAPLATPETFGTTRTQVLAGGLPFDLNGARDPVVLVRNGTWYLWYTAIGLDGVERVALATSTDGMTFTKEGLALNPATNAYDVAEGGVRPADARYDEAGARLLFSYTGVDRFGWKRVGLASSTGAGYLEDGSATFEFEHDPTGINPEADWRKILWTATVPSASTTLEIWASYFPTVKGFWSTFFPVTSGQDLPFGLEVERMRWQVRMKSTDPAVAPVLSQLEVQHAPVQFAATARALTIPITPSAGNYLLAWKTLTVETDLQAPQGGSLTLEVRDQDATPLLAAQPLATGISAPIDLSAIPVTSGGLRLLFAFTADAATYPPKSPLVKNCTVTFDSTPDGSQITLVATPPKVNSGGSVTLTGTLTGLPQAAAPVPLDGQSVAVKYRKWSQTAWTTLRTVVTAADGTFSTTARPADTTIYRVEWTPPAGPIDGVTYPPAVASVQVRLAPLVSIQVTGFTARAGKYYVYPFAKTVGIAGRLTPKIHPGSVTVRVQRLVGGKWVNHVAAKRSLTSTGAFSWPWRPRYAGSYRVKAQFLGDANHAARTSAYRYVRVQ
ncbi:MAG TPA: hypothetical protein VN317_04180, partial [Candidatus Methanoperedens sp.]|nr:hypothetical protein [Candidatus Methanoperedens sp.]